MELIRFDSYDGNAKLPFGAVAAGEPVSWTVGLSQTYGAREVLIHLRKDGAEDCVYRMGWKEAENGYDVFRFSHSMTTGLYWYHFSFLTAEGESISVFRDAQNCPVTEAGEDWQQTVYSAGFRTPDWFRGGVMYQIFPDRFARSGELRLPAGKEYAKLHWDINDLPNHVREADGSLDTNDFFGGNFRGMTEKLPYLQELGVTVLYLNPIFRAHSNHRYDTGDYESIDSLLGTEEEFRHFCQEAHLRGMRVILDGVFNHTGDNSRYFNRYGTYPELGAAQSPESPYYNWYTFEHYPDRYRAWWGVTILPAVCSDNPSYLSYITETVVPKWMSLGADGWRLDVADELSDVFLDRFYTAVKAQNPDAYVLLEVWEDASNKISYGNRRRYLLGKQADGVMNYVWKDAILQYLTDFDAKALHHGVMELCEHYPKQTLDCLMNLLGTHDTSRILTVLEGREDLVRLGFLLLATLPGVPCIYYGDEVGMTGGKDPLNRQFYRVCSTETLDFLKKLFAVRRAEPDFAHGAYQLLCAEDGYYCFRRGDLYILINATAHPRRYGLPHTCVDLLTGEETWDVQLPAFGGAVCKIS